MFLGLGAQVMHRLSKEHSGLAVRDLRVLLRSPVHEDRMLALLILVRQTGKERSRCQGENLQALPCAHSLH